MAVLHPSLAFRPCQARNHSGSSSRCPSVPKWCSKRAMLTMVENAGSAMPRRATRAGAGTLYEKAFSVLPVGGYLQAL